MFPLTKNDIWKNHLPNEDFIFDEENNPKEKVLAELHKKIEHIKDNLGFYREKDA